MSLNIGSQSHIPLTTFTCYSNVGFTVINEKETKTKNKQEINKTTPYRGKIRKMVIDSKCEYDLHTRFLFVQLTNRYTCMDKTQFRLIKCRIYRLQLHKPVTS